METNIIKYGVVVYVGFAVIVTWLLWRNPDGENTSGQLFTLFGSILLAFVAVLPSLKNEVKQEFVFPTFFRDTEQDKLLAGELFEPYYQSMSTSFDRFGPWDARASAEVKVSSVDEKIFLEYVILQTLQSTFQQAWNAPDVDSGLIQGIGIRTFVSNGPPNDEDIHKIDELQRIFNANKFVASKGLFLNGIVVPPNAEINREINPAKSPRISIKTGGFKIDIEITGSQGAAFSSDVWGMLRLKDSDNLARYKLTRYTVRITGSTVGLRKYPPKIKEYWKWYANVVSSLKQIDWTSIDAKIVDEKSRAAFWQGKSSLQRELERIDRMKEQQVSSPPSP